MPLTLTLEQRGQLEEAVRLVNECNRFAAPALVRVLVCRVCQLPFADHTSTRKIVSPAGPVCPSPGCKNQAERQRQRQYVRKRRPRPDTEVTEPEE